MVHVHADPDRQILTVKFSGQVTAAEMDGSLHRVAEQLNELHSPIIIFTDLSELDAMEPAATNQIGAFMDLCDAKGVERIVRLVPDPTKDIGFNVLAIFHYENRVPTVTCETVEEARRALEPDQ